MGKRWLASQVWSHYNGAVIDVVVVAALALAAWHGWRRGALVMLLALAAFSAGYVGAALLFRPAGNYLARTFSLAPIVALPLGGALVMAVITGVVRLGTFTVERRRAIARQQGEPPSRVDAAGGAVLGVLKGAGYAIVMAWVAMTLHSIAHVGPDISASWTGRASSAIMKRATYAVTSRLAGDPLVATMLSVVATHPQEAVQAVNALLRNQQVRGLWTNPALRTALARGDVDALAKNPVVRRLAADPGFLAAAAQLGLAPGQPGNEALAQTLATQVAPMARAVQKLSSDGEINRLMGSPEFTRLLEQGNFAALAASPQFNQLMSRMMGVLRQDRAGR